MAVLADHDINDKESDKLENCPLYQWGVGVDTTDRKVQHWENRDKDLQDWLTKGELKRK